MGMFDRVMFICPRCGHEFEVQSSSGDCWLSTFKPDKVPSAVAADLQSEIVWCQDRYQPIDAGCGVPYRINRVEGGLELQPVLEEHKAKGTS